jgi:hypothetical protein
LGIGIEADGAGIGIPTSGISARYRTGFPYSSIVLVPVLSFSFIPVFKKTLYKGGKGYIHYTLHVHNTSDGLGYILHYTFTLLVVKRDILCTSILLVVERDKPCMSNRPYFLEVEMDTPCTSILLV